MPPSAIPPIVEPETDSALLPDSFPYPPTDLLEEDSVPLESDWHRLAMNLLIEIVTHALQGRDDYFVGGNMFIYFNARQARTLDYRGPDFFFVWGRPLNPPRPYWAIWDEDGHYPDVIIELSSPRTAKIDHTTKKDIYERVFHTHEYFIYDPDDRQLMGWRLMNHRFEPIVANERGWLWCEELNMWLGACPSAYLGKEGHFPRFFNVDGQMALTAAEAAQQQAGAAQQQAEAAQLRAEQARNLAEEARKLANDERTRADAAEAELANLKAQLASGKNGNPPQ